MTTNIETSIQSFLPLLASIVGIVAVATGAALTIFALRSANARKAADGLSRLSSIRLQTDNVFDQIDNEISIIEASAPNPSAAAEIVASYQQIKLYNLKLKELFRQADVLRKDLGLTKEGDFFDEIMMRSNRMDSKIDNSINIVRTNYAQH